jgi:hypothetical protein
MKYLNYERHWLGGHDLLGRWSNCHLTVGEAALLRNEARLALRTSGRRALDWVRINTPSQCRRVE